ncbi:MAG: hypothetical protein RIR26_2430 [Pseudomonadota bacterium]|jgi:hypothetical protein
MRHCVSEESGFLRAAVGSEKVGWDFPAGFFVPAQWR